MSDTDPDELAPIFDAIEQVREASEEQAKTLGSALTELRTQVLAHYHRITKRGDESDRRLDRIEKHLELPPMDFSDG